MADDNNNFYFIQFDQAIKGPYPLKTLVDWLRAGKIHIYSRCSADKAQWENLCDVLQRHGIDWSTIARDVEIRKNRPLAVPMPKEVSFAIQAENQPSPPKGKASPGNLMNSVFGMLWHPADSLRALDGNEKRASWIILIYTIVLSLAVSAGRGWCILHRAFDWKELLIAPLGVGSTLLVVLVATGLYAWIFRLTERASLLGAILGGTMIGGTLEMALFLLLPAHGTPWKWCEILALIFLGASTVWFSSAMLELFRATGERAKLGNRYTANGCACCVILCIAILAFGLVNLYKEF